MEKVSVLKENVALHIIESHRLKNSDPQRTEALKKQITEESEWIERLKKSVVEIDTQLDHLGDELKCTQLRESLISKIQAEYPEAAEELRLHETHLQEALLQKEQAQQLQKLLKPLLALLREGSKIRLEGGFLNFIWGRNPKARLARIIHQATELSEKIYPQIKEEPFKHFLDDFLKEAKKKWNRALYRGRFSDFYHRFTQLMAALDEEIARREAIIAIEEQAIESWLNKYTQTR